MELNEFKDRLFDILNDTNELSIQDIMINDMDNSIVIKMFDETLFQIKCEYCRK